MKRRRFVQNLLVSPVLPAAAAAQQTTAPQQQPTPQPNTPARQVPTQPNGIPKLSVTDADLTSQADQRYFTATQFATLEKLAGILVPRINKNPGALEAHAPEFLDFLISVSPADRQKLYQDGLDHLDTQAKKQYQHAFSDLDPKQVDAIIRPLLVARPWPQDLPTDPMKSFMAQAHEDLRTATANSREWAEATGSSHQRTRGVSRTVGYYWNPIDPVVRD
jgi:hypothetical protein